MPSEPRGCPECDTDGLLRGAAHYESCPTLAGLDPCGCGLWLCRDCRPENFTHGSVADAE